MSLRPRPRAAPLPLLLALAACGTGAGPAEAPDTRPSDDLLERPDLQALVEAQVRREAPILIDALRSSDAAVRARAAFALGSVQAPEAAPALEALLDDTVAAVRRDAAFALGQVGDSAAQGSLLRALEVEGSSEVRAALLDALGRSGGGSALAALTARPPGEALWSDRVLAMARLLLSGARYATAADSLASWLDARDPGVRFHAAWLFSRVQDPGVIARYRDPILDALRDHPLEEPAAMHLLTALGQLGVEADTPVLLDWLERGRDWRVRVNAAQALEGRSGDAAVAAALVDALDDGSVHVRQAAGASLAASPQPAPIVAAVRTWLDAHPGDWEAAGPLLEVLARNGQGAAVLQWADRWPLDAAGPWTRAIDALVILGGDAPLGRLVRASGSPAPMVSAAALRALALRWPLERSRPDASEAYWQAFSRAAESGEGRALTVAAGALSDSVFVARGSVPLLLGAWRRVSSGDADAAAEVLAALGETRAPEAEPALRAALAHPDLRISDAAAKALLAHAGQDAAPDTAAAAERPDDRAAAARRLDWEALAALGPHPRLVLETDEGRVVLALAPEEAPVTVQTLAALAREGRFDGVPFHRVVPNFVVQGGDVGRGDGTGGPGFSIPSEPTSLRFLRGTAGMASAGKDTEGSQFFVTHAPQPHLDGGYTAFGGVVEGMDVVDRLVEGHRIVSAVVEPGPSADPR